MDALIDQLKSKNYAYIENDPYLHGFGKKNSDGLPYINGIANASLNGYSQYLNLIRAR